MSAKLIDEQKQRSISIWSTNAWVGMNPSLSLGASAAIFQIALHDTLPNATEHEIGYALGEIASLIRQGEGPRP